MDTKKNLITLAHILEQEKEASHDLWTWLPSYKAAKVCHGDYADEACPPVADVMREAAIYFAFLNGYDKSIDKQAGWFECPCGKTSGECIGPGTCRHCDMYVANTMCCKAFDSKPHCDEGKPHKECPFIRGNGGFCGK